MQATLTNALLSLRTQLEQTWSADTSTDPEGWSPACPAKGQCGVTALLVQDRFGGVILRSLVCGHSHFWNRLDDGTEVDLARDQFPLWCLTAPVEERSRDYLLGTIREDGLPTRERYTTLCARLT